MTTPRRPSPQVDTLAILKAVETSKEETRQDVAELREAVITSVTGLSERVGRTERDLAKGEMDRSSFQRELGEFRLALQDMRDLVELTANGQADRIAQASTAGAAQGSAIGATAALKGIKDHVTIQNLIGGFALAVVTFTQGQTILNALIALFGGSTGVGSE